MAKNSVSLSPFPVPLTPVQRKLLGEILQERVLQDATHGASGHPDADATLPLKNPAGYGLPGVSAARAAVRSAAREGRMAWPYILVEEVAEAVDVAGVSDTLLKRELIQVAAVALAWLEDLDLHPRRRMTVTLSEET